MKHLPVGLSFLNVDNTQITDASLTEIKRIAGLAELIASRTRVTEAGVNDLKVAMPDLKVWH
jgi:hypothetical protein